MKKMSMFFLVLSLLAFTVLNIIGQTVTGTIKGTVLDTADAAVPGVAIEIVNTETGLKRTAETNDDGSFQVTFLPLGKYQVTANKTGFGKVIRENIEVTLNDTISVDFKIDPTVTESVTITDEPPPINTTNAEVKGTLTAQQIEAK